MIERTEVRLPLPDEAATCWGLVLEARSAGNARAELSQLYFAAVYAWWRRSGHPPQAALPMAQGFLDRLVAEQLPRRGESAPGAFRARLLASLKSAAADAPRSLLYEQHHDGIAPPLPPEILEDRYLAECSDRDTPDQAFERSFGHSLVARSYARLEREAMDAGRLDDYRRLEPLLRAAAVRTPGARAEPKLPLASVLALAALRLRLRQIVEQELAGESVGDFVAVAERSTTPTR
jgi:hypothetical protein